MLSSINTLFLFSSVIIAVALPQNSSLKARNDSSDPSTPPTLNATVSDHAGNDLTSGFQITVYQEPQIVAASSLSGRGAGFSRPVSGCAGLDTQGFQFDKSWCTPRDKKAGTMQTYSYQCSVKPNSGGGSSSSSGAGQTSPAGSKKPNLVGGISITQTKTRDGRCEDNEICVDGKGGSKRKGGKMAYCVSKDQFVQLIMKGSAGEAEPRLDLEGMEAIMLLSQVDGSTPLEVDTLGMAAGAFGADGQVAADGTAIVPGQSKQCRDCIELSTDTFAPNTESLKTEATLLTAGAAVGIMWLAVMSG